MSSIRKSTPRLNRFTSLPFLIDLLERRKLVLGDPNRWEDLNDSMTLDAYRRERHAVTIFALCFCGDFETIHHWASFAGGPSGCCIEFDRELLVQRLQGRSGVTHGDGEYMRLRELRNADKPVLPMRPFIKRDAYRCEREFRILWEGPATDTFEIDLDLTEIRRVTLSQRMTRSTFLTLSSKLENDFPILAGKVNQSTIYRNDEWIRALS